MRQCDPNRGLTGRTAPSGPDQRRGAAHRSDRQRSSSARRPASVSQCRILVTESAGFSPAAARLLAGLGDLRLADLDRRALLESVDTVTVLWIRLRHRIDKEVMAAAPHLK